MANKINYQKLMEDLIKENCMDNDCTPRLLLHSCCGPCSTYCIQTLSEYFKVTVFYYNPSARGISHESTGAEALYR